MKAGGSRGIRAMTPGELRRQRARNDRLSGRTPPPDGRGLCVQCGEHVIVLTDGRLRSHRYKGWVCPGGGAKP